MSTQKERAAHWTTGISEIKGEDILIRGYPMQELQGKLPFSGIAFLILRGSLPNQGEIKVMEALLSSILDYGLKKSGTLAARSVVSVNPQMTAGLSAGMLGAGKYAVSPEDAGRFIIDGFSSWKKSKKSLEEHATQVATDLRSRKQRVPGLGHPVFRGVDPRSETLKKIAIENEVWGEVNDWYSVVHNAFRLAANKPDLVMNDVGMIAGIMAQMGFTPEEMSGLSLLSTMPGLIAHISEEIQTGVHNRVVPDTHVEYIQPQRDLSHDLSTTGW